MQNSGRQPVIGVALALTLRFTEENPDIDKVDDVQILFVLIASSTKKRV